jgi:sulfur carrier protein
VRLVVNGEGGSYRDGLTVAELVAAVAATTRGVAVSVDQVIVPRSTWATTTLDDGAAVEVLAAAAGG